jgi:hypothetical protein
MTCYLAFSCKQMQLSTYEVARYFYCAPSFSTSR